MKVRMKDIALKAGVSRSAVSAVLNGTTASKVSDTTRQRILRIAKELNYQRNPLATALKTKKTGILGFICGGLEIPFFSELTMAMTKAAEERNYKLMLAIMPWDKPFDVDYIDAMLTSMCDGVFLFREITAGDKVLQDKIEKSQTPFVLLDSELKNISSVSFDYQIGMEKAFDELLANGHRKIAAAGYSGDIHKWQAYRRYCSIHNIEPIEYDFVEKTDLNSVIECGKQIATNIQRQTALITTDYCMSKMVLGLDAVGVRIPQDLSIVAFNDTVQSRFFRPPLTSISLDTKLMARYGLDIMLNQIENKDTAKVKSVVIPPELIKRNSVVTHQ